MDSVNYAPTKGNGGNALNSHLYQQKREENEDNHPGTWSNRTEWWDEIAYGLTMFPEVKVSRKGDSDVKDDQFRCFTIL